jgi:hypothetical protein
MKQILFIGLLTIFSLIVKAEGVQTQTLVGKFARVSCAPAEANMPDKLVISKWPTSQGIDYEYKLDANNKNLLVIKKYDVAHSFFPNMPHEETECLYSRQID